MQRPLMSVAIHLFLERFGSDAMHDVDEAFGVGVAMFEIALDQALDDIGNVCPGKGRPKDFAERSAECGDVAGAMTGFPLVSADLDLVPLFAVLIDAEDADMAYVVMTAGVHAAGDIEIQLADVVQVIE